MFKPRQYNGLDILPIPMPRNVKKYYRSQPDDYTYYGCYKDQDEYEILMKGLKDPITTGTIEIPNSLIENKYLQTTLLIAGIAILTFYSLKKD